MDAIDTNTGTVVVEMGNRQDKKHSVRYDAVSPSPAVQSIYVRTSDILSMGNPEKIMVRVEPVPAVNN